MQDDKLFFIFTDNMQFWKEKRGLEHKKNALQKKNYKLKIKKSIIYRK